MSEEEDASYRRRLSEVLNEHGFGWVVTQAEAQIAEGKQSSKQVSERESVSAFADPMFAIHRPRSRRASLITSEPYTEREQLEILLQGIEAAVVQRAMLEQAILDQLTDISSIRFERDSPVEDGGDSFFGSAHSLDFGRKAAAAELEAEARTALAHMRGRDSAGS